jgi:hypothetical protein
MVEVGASVAQVDQVVPADMEALVQDMVVECPPVPVILEVDFYHQFIQLDQVVLPALQPFEFLVALRHLFLEDWRLRMAICPVLELLQS